MMTSTFVVHGSLRKYHPFDFQSQETLGFHQKTVLKKVLHTQTDFDKIRSALYPNLQCLKGQIQVQKPNSTVTASQRFSHI